MTSKAKQERQREATDRLRDRYNLRPGSVVHTSLRHVSRSGMTRDIAVLVVGSDGDIVNISETVASAIDMRTGADYDSVRISGAGMDMGFAIVYDLSRVLFADGFPCSGQQSCPANDHVNERGDDRVNGYRAGRMHSDPGYALTQRWI